jgi:hypothetical protein
MSSNFRISGEEQAFRSEAGFEKSRISGFEKSRISGKQDFK